MRPWTLIFGAVLAPLALAEGEGAEPLPEPPQLSAEGGVQDGVPIKPEVTVVRSKDATMEEHRINGRLYAVKVIPAVGHPYYLLDGDGDGRLEHRGGDLDRVRVPEWVIFSW